MALAFSELDTLSLEMFWVKVLFWAVKEIVVNIDIIKINIIDFIVVIFWLFKISYELLDL